MTERLIDAWRTKADSPTGFAVREFLLAFRRSITLADSVGERSISLGDGESIASTMRKHFCTLPEIKKEINELPQRKSGTNSSSHNHQIAMMERSIGDRWFNDDFRLGLAKEGFTIKYSYVSMKTEFEWSETESGFYPDELKIVNKEDYPVAMPSGVWTEFIPFKSEHIRREIELTWD
ncbi:MAG: hypothetical protein P8Q94_03660 [Candidatus Poseidoniaceae archaeon]|nr:hypothetical protein [Candidatus Poseidoniaceae archaeon]